MSRGAWSVDRTWRGTPDRGPGWLLTRVIPMLTKWPLKYSWKGRMTCDGIIEGSWTNVDPVG